MSLFANNSSKLNGRHSHARKCNAINSLFRESEKIINVTKIVTQVVTLNVTKKIEAINLLYDNLYDDVGEAIRNIFKAFANGSDELRILINFENFTNLAEKLYTHFSEDNANLEKFRNMLIDALEGVRHCDNKMQEQQHAYNTLLTSYNFIAGVGEDSPLIEVSAPISTVATIRPEIVEYINRGYSIVDDEGNLIPINMTILAQIREELNLT